MVANYELIGDVTIPDDIDLLVGTTFIKTWALKNTGDVAWEAGFTVRFEDNGSTNMAGATQFPLPKAQPGETVELSIEMTAPSQQGRYYTDYECYDAQGNHFGNGFYVRIDAVNEVAFRGTFDAVYVADVTIPDGTEVEAGSKQLKKWKIRNVGTLPWNGGLELAHTGGDPMGQTTISLPDAKIGEAVDVSASLIMPSQAGKHTGRWSFRTVAGKILNRYLETVVMTTKTSDDKTTHTNLCEWVADVTIPDDSTFITNTSFTKTWHVRNAGTQAWGAGYTLRWVDGHPMTNVQSVPLPACAPGAEVDISVDLTTPNENGEQFSTWQCFDANGQAFPETVWTRINVAQNSANNHAKGNKGRMGGTNQNVTAGSSQQGSVRDGANIQAGMQFSGITVTHYSQKDPRWAKTVLGTGSKTIGAWGCLMTSMTMYANFKGFPLTPLQFMEIMKKKGCFVGGHDTMWKTLQLTHGIPYDGDNWHPYRGSDLVQRINAKLASGLPVIVQVDRDPKDAYTPDETHWVLVVGKKGDNDYWMNDPNDVTSSPRSLMERYGRASNDLESSLVSILLYR